jgi:hypothetical protein
LTAQSIKRERQSSRSPAGLAQRYRQLLDHLDVTLTDQPPELILRDVDG